MAVLVVCASIAICSGHNTPLTRVELSEPHMGTTVTVVAYAQDDAQGGRAARAAFDRIAELDARLSDYRDESEATLAARDAADGPVRVSDDLYCVLALAQGMAARTGGAFDVTVGPLTRLWRRARRQGELPAAREVAAARQLIGWTLLRLDSERRSLRAARRGMRFDFGGIAKGYAADRALEAMREAGISRALVVAGGDVAAGDPPPGEAGWRIAIAPFDGVGGAGVTVTRAGVSTSGDAEQWVEVDGVRYSHILDPRTGVPLTGRRQATVVARDAATSDMLATTLCVLGVAEGVGLVDRTPGAAAMMGISDGRHAPRWTYSRDWVHEPR